MAELSADEQDKRRRCLETMEALEVIRAKELAAMTDEEALRILKTLVAFEEPWRENGEWSGLVEQQAIFQKAMREGKGMSPTIQTERSGVKKNGRTAK